MAGWVRALRPVCASSEMRARFPDLPDDADDLIAVAWAVRRRPTISGCRPPRSGATATRASGVPDDVAGSFPDVAGARPLSWLLRG